MLANQTGDERRLEKGEILLTPEKANDSVFVVLKGRLAVYLEAPGGVPYTFLGPGECAGEMSALDNENPSAWVIAAEPTHLMVVDQENFRKLMQQSSGVTRNIMRTLSNRLRNGVQELAERERHANVDILTGLHNRRWLDSMFQKGIDQAVHEQTTLSLLMIDVDHFKEYNDNHGHLAGDKALASVAKCIKSQLRPCDLLARYGGEEFSALLIDTPIYEAMIAAERLRQGVEENIVDDRDPGRHPKVTISIGVAEWVEGKTLDELLHEADACLYDAKQAGRNRVSSTPRIVEKPAT